MAQQQLPRPDEIATGPKTSPQTDPTNPYPEEAAGVWTRAEEVPVWKVDEPGLTNRDCQARSV